MVLQTLLPWQEMEQVLLPELWMEWANAAFMAVTFSPCDSWSEGDSGLVMPRAHHEQQEPSSCSVRAGEDVGTGRQWHRGCRTPAAFRRAWCITPLHQRYTSYG